MDTPAGGAAITAAFEYALLNLVWAAAQTGASSPVTGAPDGLVHAWLPSDCTAPARTLRMRRLQSSGSDGQVTVAAHAQLSTAGQAQTAPAVVSAAAADGTLITIVRAHVAANAAGVYAAGALPPNSGVRVEASHVQNAPPASGGAGARNDGEEPGVSPGGVGGIVGGLAGVMLIGAALFLYRRRQQAAVTRAAAAPRGVGDDAPEFAMKNPVAVAQGA